MQNWERVWKNKRTKEWWIGTAMSWWKASLKYWKLFERKKFLRSHKIETNFYLNKTHRKTLFGASRMFATFLLHFMSTFVFVNSRVFISASYLNTFEALTTTRDNKWAKQFIILCRWNCILDTILFSCEFHNFRIICFKAQKSFCLATSDVKRFNFLGSGIVRGCYKLR